MSEEITVAELFAGVGGFRLGLDGYQDSNHPEWTLPAAGPYKTIWANQWEPPGTKARQFAARCYETHFGPNSVINQDIHEVLDEYESGQRDIPAVDMVVGGFPCQDYSVARPLSAAKGIEGKKGVLWWDIYHFLQIQLQKDASNARWCMFENVDRLLKSPATQRGRDFAIILSCLATLGYSVEWHVVNSAEYGFPQRRKRVYIVAERNACWDLDSRLEDGIMSEAFPMETPREVFGFEIPKDPYEATLHFNEQRTKTSPFLDAGVMQGFQVRTCKISETYAGPRATLGDVLVPEQSVPEEFYVPSDQLSRWEYLKGAKHEPRTSKSGHQYIYSEGSMAFPDPTDRPSRTILTGEGGTGPSRFKHVIQTSDGRYRRLVPDELDNLQGFPTGWTNTGMTNGQRAFCMGNALVVGIPHRIGEVIARRTSLEVR